MGKHELSVARLLPLTSKKCLKRLYKKVGATLVKRGDLSQRARNNTVRNVKLCKKGSNVAQHAWNNDHRIDLKQCQVIDKGNFNKIELLNHGTPLQQKMQIVILNRS